jgi:hypothetical protein
MDGHLRSLKLTLTARDFHAHPVSRRFAEFCCSILLILHDTSNKKQQPSVTTPTKAAVATTPVTTMASAISSRSSQRDKTAGDKLLEDLQEMMDEYVALLERLADEQKHRTVFLINNLDLVVTIFQERRVVGKEFNFFVEMLMKQREVFVEEELLTGFSKLIAFVQQTEAYMAEEKATPLEVNAQVVESLVLDFRSHWKAHMEQINRNVLSYFSNFRNGMEILKQVLTQLLLYYTRFHDIIRKSWKKPPPFCKDLVPTHLILAEIKKYALAI